MKLPNPTGPAKQLWAAVYREPWPAGWRVRWVGLSGRRSKWFNTEGCVQRDRKLVILNYRHAIFSSVIAELKLFKVGRPEWDIGGVFDTILHELVHVRHPEFDGCSDLDKHGMRFQRLLNDAKKRLMGCSKRPRRRSEVTYLAAS